MRNVSAILLDSATSKPVLQSIVLPEPKAGEAIVRILATPVHPADLNTIEGKYPGVPNLGREGIGVVESLGPGTTTPAPGVCVLLPSGTPAWRQACICQTNALVEVPADVPIEVAATLRTNPASALRMLRDFVSLQPGEWVIQNAANSAVGQAAIQLARALGWRTINLVRRPEVMDSLRAIGADQVLLDDAEAPSRIREIAGDRVRLALNAVGGESALRQANALGDGGTIVTYGAMARQPLKIPNGLLIFKDVRFVGFWLSRWEKGAALEEINTMMRELVALAQRGALTVQIDQRYPMQEFAAAIEHAKQSQRNGKILLTND